jgi:hypothetical protein
MCNITVKLQNIEMVFSPIIKNALFLNFILVKTTCLEQNYSPKHIESFTKIKLRNSASRWLLL